MRGPTRRYVALDGNSKIYEKTHSKLLRVYRFKGSICTFDRISRQ
jgi:hypothetical protein